jgi:hypothetical protein
MCQAKPGPRCSPHAHEAYQHALTAYDAAGPNSHRASEVSPLDRPSSSPLGQARALNELGYGDAPIAARTNPDPPGFVSTGGYPGGPGGLMQQASSIYTEGNVNTGHSDSFAPTARQLAAQRDARTPAPQPTVADIKRLGDERAAAAKNLAQWDKALTRKSPHPEAIREAHRNALIAHNQAEFAHVEALRNGPFETREDYAKDLTGRREEAATQVKNLDRLRAATVPAQVDLDARREQARMNLAALDAQVADEIDRGTDEGRVSRRLSKLNPTYTAEAARLATFRREVAAEEERRRPAAHA